MGRFELGNGHTLLVENANRGIEDDYLVSFLEDGKKIGLSEYYSSSGIEEEFGITL